MPWSCCPALVPPYDPAAGFNVDHAMGRNKLVKAPADTALVVGAEYQMRLTKSPRSSTSSGMMARSLRPHHGYGAPINEPDRQLTANRRIDSVSMVVYVIFTTKC